MVWLVVDKDGIESLHYDKPFRYQDLDYWCASDPGFTNLVQGTIEKLIGYPLTWEDEPFELK